MSEPARRSVAVVLDGPRPPAWQVHAVELLASSPRLAVAEVRLVDAPKRLGRQPRATAESSDISSAARTTPLRRPTSSRHPTSGGDASLTLWLASADPPAGLDIVELRYGPFGERAEPAFRRAIANDDGVVVIEATLHARRRTARRSSAGPSRVFSRSRSPSA